MRINILKEQKGFLLVDVIIGLCILVVVLVGVAGMFVQSSRTTQNSAQITIQADLAQKAMEELQEKGWDYLNDDKNFKTEAEVEKNNPNYNAAKPDKFKEKYYVTVKKPILRDDFDKKTIMELQVVVRTENEAKGTGHKYIAFYTNPK